MNDKAVAKELVAVAKELTALKSDFQVVKVLQLVAEGSTRMSLDNAQRIKDAGYMLVGGKFSFDTNMADWKTVAKFKWAVDGSVETHTFQGFSFGYGGEGPRGLQSFLKIFGWNPSEAKIVRNTFGMEKGTVRLRDFL